MLALGRWAMGLALVVSTSTALAGVDMGLKDCHVRFASDFSVKPAGIHTTQSERVYVLRHDGEVRVDGASLTLTPQQRSLVVDYTGDVRAFMPELVAFVKDTLHIVGEVMGQALAQVFGADSEPALKVRQSLLQSEAKFSQQMAARPGEYRVVSERLEVLDLAFNEDFELAIAEAVEASVSSVWSMLGNAMFGQGDFEQRMTDFGVKMERFGDQVEKDMEAQEPALEKRGEALCERAEAIEKMEYRLRETIPELAHYRLMDSRKKARAAAETAKLSAQ